MTALGETILVVDDDPYIQEALGDRLESLGGSHHANRAICPVLGSCGSLVYIAAF